jgi:hypothetical protein
MKFEWNKVINVFKKTSTELIDLKESIYFGAQQIKYEDLVNTALEMIKRLARTHIDLLQIFFGFDAENEFHSNLASFIKTPIGTKPLETTIIMDMLDLGSKMKQIIFVVFKFKDFCWGILYQGSGINDLNYRDFVFEKPEECEHIKGISTNDKSTYMWGLEKCNCYWK